MMNNNKPEMKSWITGCWSPVLTTSTPNSGSESDLLQRDLINERKRKRLESNRESARRSRMRKRERLDDLNAQVVQLRKDNRKTTAEIAVTTEHYVKIEAENSVLRAQLTELNHRLSSLNQIIAFAESFEMETGQGGGGADYGGGDSGGDEFYDGAMNPLNLGFYNQTPNMTSASTGFGDVPNCW
ncbi:unnamed protein product [Eruca vesicaria subsp. sativa]|uniref:BZIP domain-containing protein n=1 Tax=Eruca vesicaria subsp. sativa TaxID=29727 RepID=A0ABC8LID1_ERUVS|nr:unnamed protein product [Eruca vesicaria subsp. sativa]